MVMQRRFVDDDDDDSLFDPAYPGLKVVPDGGRVRVPIALTDGAPSGWLASSRPHRVAVLDSAELRDARRRAAEAREQYIARICDAHRGPGSQLAPEPRPGESPRDAWIRRTANAHKTPIGQVAPADDIEAAREQWLSPGAKPRMGDARPAVSREALADARASRDQAWQEMVKRNAEAHKFPNGARTRW
jgi:hypothetical protein